MKFKNNYSKCVGAVIGDACGNGFLYSGKKPDTLNFPLFSRYSHYSDDTILTLATMDCLINESRDFAHYYRKWFKKYPNADYGMLFYEWAINSKAKAYGSYGNGSAMRVSPVAYYGKTLKEVEALAKLSALPTHNHPDGIKGAVAIAGCIFLARTKHSKKDIKEYALKFYPRINNLHLEKLHKNYKFNATCEGSVPEAIYAFLISKNFEDCLRKAIYIGGDMDTIGAMAGSISEAYYGISEKIKNYIYFNNLLIWH